MTQIARKALVVGAGFVGTSSALHLARRGWDVTLIDKSGPAGGASFGNAGIIQREAVEPYAFPRALSPLLKALVGRNIGISYHWDALPVYADALLKYWWNSAPARHAQITRAYATMIAQSLVTHGEQIEWAGEEADQLVRRDGWYDLLSTPAGKAKGLKHAEMLRDGYGVPFTYLDGKEIAEVEPHLLVPFSGALYWSDTWTVRDPGALNGAYARAFAEAGGKYIKAEMGSMTREADQWVLRDLSGVGIESAPHLMLATGAWSMPLLKKLGYHVPFFVKRGYHRHFEMHEDKPLNNWVAELETGYLLAPMARGIRLTSGAELARLDAPKTPVQIEAAEKLARSLFPLGKRVEAEPWMGGRPCIADMLPVMGPAPRHDGLWFALGHGHQGLTMGPATGRHMADLMEGKTPVVDPAPFLPSRFG